MTLLKAFPQEVAVETKVLGLLNNIAEVSPLRSALINIDFMTQLRLVDKNNSYANKYAFDH